MRGVKMRNSAGFSGACNRVSPDQAWGWGEVGGTRDISLSELRSSSVSACRSTSALPLSYGPTKWRRRMPKCSCPKSWCQATLVHPRRLHSTQYAHSRRIESRSTHRRGRLCRINSLPEASPSCSTVFGTTNPSDYTVIFMRWGIPMEVVTHSQVGCPAWSINRGGIPDRLPHNDPTNAMVPILAQLQPQPGRSIVARLLGACLTTSASCQAITTLAGGTGESAAAKLSGRGGRAAGLPAPDLSG